MKPNVGDQTAARKQGRGHGGVRAAVWRPSGGTGARWWLRWCRRRATVWYRVRCAAAGRWASRRLTNTALDRLLRRAGRKWLLDSCCLLSAEAPRSGCVPQGRGGTFLQNEAGHRACAPTPTGPVDLSLPGEEPSLVARPQRLTFIPLGSERPVGRQETAPMLKNRTQ